MLCPVCKTNQIERVDVIEDKETVEVVGDFWFCTICDWEQLTLKIVLLEEDE